MCIGVPIVVILLLRLTPGIISAKFFRSGSSDAPTCPLRARRQTEVDGIGDMLFILRLFGLDYSAHRKTSVTKIEIIEQPKLVGTDT